MAKSVLVNFTPATSAVAAAATTYCGLGMGGSGVYSTTEANTQIIHETAGTLSSLYVYISANTVSATSTYTVRKNGADGNLTVSVTASTTGAFTDVTHSDTVAAADKMGIKVVAGGTGTSITSTVQTFQFDATSGTNVRFYGLVGNNITSNGITLFYTFPGTSSGTGGAAETASQFKFKTSGTLKNLALHVATNARAVTDTIKTRINGADGNLVISITSGATGFFEDLTHTELISSGTLGNLAGVYGASTSAIAINDVAFDFSTTNNTSHVIGGGSFFFAFSGIMYSRLEPESNTNATEANMQSSSPIPFSLSNFEIYVSANGRAATDTFTSRLNGAPGAQSISVTAAATGYFEDTTNSDSISAGDKVAFKYAPGDALFTSITAQTMGALMTMAAPAGGTPDSYISQFN